MIGSMAQPKHQPRFPWRQGNHCRLLLDGEHFFSEILAALDAVKSHVFLELYLMESGQVADRFITALVQAAERGVKVFLLLDDYGSMGLKEADRRRLMHPHIQVVYYNPLSSYSTLRNIYRIVWHKIGYDLHRDHRKLILVDGALAFVGGLGITDEFDPPHHPEKRWRETVLEIAGPVVADWHSLFVQAWNRYAPTPITVAAPRPALIRGGAGARVAFSEGNSHNDIKHQLLRHINSAQQRIWLCTAYFLPSWRMLRTLQRAARNGVDVRLLLPGQHTDHPVVRHAGRRHYQRLLRHGVRIFEYQPRVLHAKVLLCDGWVSLGSNNFDHWGLNWNLEANQEVEDPAFANAVRRMFEDDFGQSVEITLAAWGGRTSYQRLLEGFWGWVDRVMLRVTNRTRRRR